MNLHQTSATFSSPPINTVSIHPPKDAETRARPQRERNAGPFKTYVRSAPAHERATST